jgi:large subunit ribosomal protein L25
MTVGENLLVQDLEAPEGVKILTNPDEVVAAVVAPAAVVEEEPAEEAGEAGEAAEGDEEGAGEE